LKHPVVYALDASLPEKKPYPPPYLFSGRSGEKK